MGEMRIIYMGTPEFAVAPLKALVEGGYEIVAVVTMPDKPAGRGHHVQYSAVKEYALSVGLPVLQPEKLKDEAFVKELRSYKADLQIVVAFRMLPEVVWAMPRLGTFNLHASLLPQYRGAAPINWAVINGDKETGVTTFMLKHEIDTGNIILQERIPIGEDENVGSVHDRLMELGTGLVLRTVDLIAKADADGTEDVGEQIAENIVAYFADIRNLEIITRLQAAGVQMSSEQLADEQLAVPQVLEGKTIVISGTFSEHSRDEYKQMIEDYGGKNSGSVSKKTDFILAGENMGPAKLEKAQSLGVQVISEQEFLEMIKQEIQ